MCTSQAKSVVENLCLSLTSIGKTVGLHTSMSSSSLDLPVFAGQGTDSVDSSRIDLNLPSNTLLLSSCFDAFHTELSQLSLAECKDSGIDPADFKSPGDILSPLPEHYNRNPIISGIQLFLLRSTRYLAYIESSNNSQNRFTDVLKGNVANNLGILGFSSGILPACVVAASRSTLAYISNSVEAYRLAFWIGVRTLGYRRSVLMDGEDDLPWSVVLVGMDRHEAQAAIDDFQFKVENVLSLLLSTTDIFYPHRIITPHPWASQQ